MGTNGLHGDGWATGKNGSRKLVCEESYSVIGQQSLVIGKMKNGRRLKTSRHTREEEEDPNHFNKILQK